jgi:hypothetical protein
MELQFSSIYGTKPDLEFDYYRLISLLSKQSIIYIVSIK